MNCPVFAFQTVQFKHHESSTLTQDRPILIFHFFKNAEEEDKFENKISRLQEEFKLADTRAEFAERSVDKLEATIDGLLESLMNEKLNYRNISEKLDKTLNDMMSMQ